MIDVRGGHHLHNAEVVAAAAVVNAAELLAARRVIVPDWPAETGRGSPSTAA